MKTLSAPPVASVDRQHPWLGLVSFTEETSGFFHGREEEAAELSRRVQRKLLTVLFGQSGLGKTSILQAGLVPRLRPEGYCPIYVRIDYNPAAPSPAEQIKRAVARETGAMGQWTQAGPAGAADETLWEYFHHRGDVLQKADGQPLIPLIIFDQFEEIFTLAQGDDAGRQRAQAFLAELSDLVENRPPAALEARIDRDEADAAQFDFARADYRVLISLREDYLAHLEGLKAQMPSVTQNRMRLARMTGPQAVAAVRAPAPDLVSEAVAEAIVRFVSGGTTVTSAEVEPSLLSLICRELNEARLAAGQAEISADLLAGSRETILSEFYERALADQPARVRSFIEDELLTDSGFRESVAEERVRKAFAAAGAPAGALAQLVDRRLLRVEDRLDLRRVEITHDVLSGVVAASRRVRHERDQLEESRRQLAAQKAQEAETRRELHRARRVVVVCLALSVVCAASAIFGFVNLRRARAAEAQAESTGRLAESARGEAEKLVGFLIEDFYNELEPTGRLDTMGRLAHMAVAYYDGLPSELRSAGTQAYRGMALVREGAAAAARGDVAAGRKLLDEAERVFTKLRQAGDASEDTTVGLAVALLTKGGLANVGDAADLKSAAELLRPVALAAGASRQVRRIYAETLSRLSIVQPAEVAMAACEDARKILVELGATDLSDLAAAAAYADATNSAARAALALGQFDDAERYQKEVLDLSEKVLAKRPGDLKAMLNRGLAPEVLSQIAFRRLDFAGALVFARKSAFAAEDYVRYNPSDAIGWQMWASAQEQAVNCLLAQGRVGDAIATARAGAALEQDPRNQTGLFQEFYQLWATIAVTEAQLGDRAGADEAVQALQRIVAAAPAKAQLDRINALLLTESAKAYEARVIYYSGDYPEAYAESLATLARLETIIPDTETATYRRDQLLELVYGTATLAALHLSQGESAERVAQGLYALPLKGLSPDRVSYGESWRRVLLAQALVLQGKRAEAKPLLEPALAYYREQHAKTITSVNFLQRMARAIGNSAAPAAAAKPTASVELHLRAAQAYYVSALLQGDDSDGRVARRAVLDEAGRVLQGVPEEAKQLREWKELNDLVFKTRARPGK